MYFQSVIIFTRIVVFSIMFYGSPLLPECVDNVFSITRRGKGSVHFADKEKQEHFKTKAFISLQCAHTVQTL